MYLFLVLPSVMAGHFAYSCDGDVMYFLLNQKAEAGKKSNEYRGRSPNYEPVTWIGGVELMGGTCFCVTCQIIKLRTPSHMIIVLTLCT